LNQFLIIFKSKIIDLFDLLINLFEIKQLSYLLKNMAQHQEYGKVLVRYPYTLHLPEASAGFAVLRIFYNYVTPYKSLCLSKNFNDKISTHPSKTFVIDYDSCQSLHEVFSIRVDFTDANSRGWLHILDNGVEVVDGCYSLSSTETLDQSHACLVIPQRLIMTPQHPQDTLSIVVHADHVKRIQVVLCDGIEYTAKSFEHSMSVWNYNYN